MVWPISKNVSGKFLNMEHVFPTAQSFVECIVNVLSKDPGITRIAVCGDAVTPDFCVASKICLYVEGKRTRDFGIYRVDRFHFVFSENIDFNDKKYKCYLEHLQKYGYCVYDRSGQTAVDIEDPDSTSEYFGCAGDCLCNGQCTPHDNKEGKIPALSFQDMIERELGLSALLTNVCNSDNYPYSCNIDALQHILFALEFLLKHDLEMHGYFCDSLCTFSDLVTLYNENSLNLPLKKDFKDFFLKNLDTYDEALTNSIRTKSLFLNYEDVIYNYSNVLEAWLSIGVDES